MITGQFPAGTDALSALVKTDANVEEYRGETYKLEHREIFSFVGPARKVWCWEVLSGPSQGDYGGKCGTKAEARKWARHSIRVVGPEIARQTAVKENS